MIPVRCAGGIVSFTFDDFPQSAANIGSKILEAHGVSGTYYLSGGLADCDGETEPFFSTSSVMDLTNRGHEIGCHTFAHSLVSELDVSSLHKDSDRNQDWVTKVVPDYTLTSFAYPGGAVSLRSKYVLGDRFRSCRWNEAGININSVDVSLLRANKVYSHLENMSELETLIDKNRELGGWLIFYTHDVSNTPSRYGCTPAELNHLVAYAVSSGSKMLSVRNALGALAFTF
jgi:peptidoglycan/xylan/chitin deacetylase (PgdA/CDA1 family)